MELSAWKTLPAEVCAREAEAAGIFLGYNLNQLKLKIKTTACSLSTFLGEGHDIPEERCQVSGLLELPASNFLARLVRELPRKNQLGWLDWVTRIATVVCCATPFFTRMAYGMFFTWMHVVGYRVRLYLTINANVCLSVGLSLYTVVWVCEFFCMRVPFLHCQVFLHLVRGRTLFPSSPPFAALCPWCFTVTRVPTS
jgi:hypothetical protein